MRCVHLIFSNLGIMWNIATFISCSTLIFMRYLVFIIATAKTQLYKDMTSLKGM